MSFLNLKTLLFHDVKHSWWTQILKLPHVCIFVTYLPSFNVSRPTFFDWCWSVFQKGACAGTTVQRMLVTTGAVIVIEKLLLFAVFAMCIPTLVRLRSLHCVSSPAHTLPISMRIRHGMRSCCAKMSRCGVNCTGRRSQVWDC